MKGEARAGGVAQDLHWWVRQGAKAGRRNQPAGSGDGHPLRDRVRSGLLGEVTRSRAAAVARHQELMAELARLKAQAGSVVGATAQDQALHAHVREQAVAVQAEAEGLHARYLQHVEELRQQADVLDSTWRDANLDVRDALIHLDATDLTVPPHLLEPF